MQSKWSADAENAIWTGQRKFHGSIWSAGAENAIAVVTKCGKLQFSELADQKSANLSEMSAFCELADQNAAFFLRGPRFASLRNPQNSLRTHA